MTTLTFEDLSFQEENNKIKVNFLNLFYFYLEKSLLNEIGNFNVTKNSISFVSKNGKSSSKFYLLLEHGFNNLTNRLNNKKTIYIHKNSQIPLIGTNYFGLIDRGTNLIEIKPITSCNLRCNYCSVDEGPNSRRKIDFVVEKDYIIQEFKKIVEFKKINNIDAHINSQGEPLLYADIISLVKDISKINQVKVISIDTNGTLLTFDLIDKLADAGLTRINLSLNSLNQQIANQMAGTYYNLKKVLQIAEYIPKKMDLLIAPVWLPGYNDNELVNLAKFAEEIGAGKNCPPIGIQNFLPYKHGRNPVKPVSLDFFYETLTELEKQHNVKLIYNKHDFNITPAGTLPKPFNKGEIIKAEIKFPGRLKNEMLAVSKDRMISVYDCFKDSGFVKIKILRTKHNIFSGVSLN